VIHAVQRGGLGPSPRAVGAGGYADAVLRVKLGDLMLFTMSALGVLSAGSVA
jgi:hypothetical protein